MSIEPPLSTEVVAFWREAGRKMWFVHDEAFDEAIRTRFEAVHQAASRGDYADWIDTAEGALALLLLLDQFPRNLYRGSAHAFATDAMARHVANRALEAGHDQATADDLRAFFYLPFEHSENLDDQARAVALMAPLSDESYVRFAILHQDIIARFGRFPHRNRVMGRDSTPEELAFLAGGGFAG